MNNKFYILLLFLLLLMTSFIYQSTEICDNEIDDDGDGLIDCYDPDCGCEQICLNNYYQECEIDCSENIFSDEFSAKIKWQSSELLSNFGQLIAGDLNNDGWPEIIARSTTTNSQTRPIYYSDKVKIFSRKSDGSYVSSSINLRISGNTGAMAIADIQRDENPELIIIGMDGLIHIYSDFNGANIRKKMSSTSKVNVRSSINIADFDEDGLPEIYVGNEVFIFSDNFTKITSSLRGSGAKGKKYIWNYNGGLELEAPVAVDILSRKDCGGDPDCDGLELVCGPIIYSIDLSTADGDGREIKIQFDANKISNTNFNDGPVGVADMDMDGLLDVVVNGSWQKNGSTVYGTYIYNPVINSILLKAECPSSHSSVGALGIVTIANVIDDVQSGYTIDMPEIILIGQDLMYCVGLNKANDGVGDGIIWKLKIKDNSSYTGCTVFDFNGDGLHEIVYRDEQNVRILYGGNSPFPSGVDLNRNWVSERGGSATGNEYPLILDVDGDGHSEIVVMAGATLSLQGNLRIYESKKIPWLPSRILWNQLQYFNVNINDDLTIPKVQQKHHWVGDNLILNTFLNQYGNKEYPLPDGGIDNVGYDCNNNGIELIVKICNTGNKLLPSRTPISVYDKNPLVESANRLTTIYLDINLQVDSCTEIILPIMVNVDKLFIVLNADEQQITPIRINSEFPKTRIIECDYYNNFDSIYINKTNSNLDLGPDRASCLFENVILKSNEKFKKYLWQDGSTDSSFNVIVDGLYWLEIEDNCGNTLRDTIIIIIKPPPPLEKIKDITICYGEELNISIDKKDYNYFEWYSNHGLVCKNCDFLKDIPEHLTTYVLNAQTKEGCEISDTFVVEVILPKHTFDTLNICFGDTIDVFDNKVWQQGDFEKLVNSQLQCDSTHHIRVELERVSITEIDTTICYQDSAYIFGKWRYNEGEFIEKYNVNSFCDSISIIRLTISPEINGVVPDKVFICQDQHEIEIVAHLTGGFGDLSYYWNAEIGRESKYLGLGSHELVVVDEFGCWEIFEIDIRNVERPKYFIEKSGISCFGENDGVLTIIENPLNYVLEYSLNDPDFNTPPPFVNLEPGEYIIYSRDSMGCVFYDTVYIFTPDSLELDITNDTTIFLGEQVNLISHGNFDQSDVSYTWKPSESLSCSDCPNPIAKPLKTTTYELTVIDKNGCIVIRVMTIIVKVDVMVYIPNVFTPNGDGINDGFTIYSNENVAEIEYLEIYDRWGEMVYRGTHFMPNDPSVGWNGTFNKKDMNPGVFVFIAGIKLLDESINVYHGDVTLVR